MTDSRLDYIELLQQEVTKNPDVSDDNFLLDDKWKLYITNTTVITALTTSEEVSAVCGCESTSTDIIWRRLWFCFLSFFSQPELWSASQTFVFVICEVFVFCRANISLSVQSQNYNPTTGEDTSIIVASCWWMSVEEHEFSLSLPLAHHLCFNILSALNTAASRGCCQGFSLMVAEVVRCCSRQVCSGVSSSPQRLVDVGKEDKQEETPLSCRSLPQLCSIPRRLVISPGLGGTPVTPQLTEVRDRLPVTCLQSVSEEMWAGHLTLLLSVGSSLVPQSWRAVKWM